MLRFGINNLPRLSTGSNIIIQNINININIDHRRTFFSGISGSPPPVQDYQIKKILSIPPQQVYQAVSDVASYSEFLPFCVESNVTKTIPDTDIPLKVVLKVGWNQFDEAFESNVSFTDTTVTATAADSSMFKELYTKWTVLPLEGKEDKCLVDFNLRYAFNNSLYHSVSNAFAPKVASIMIKAFSERAAKINSNR